MNIINGFISRYADCQNDTNINSSKSNAVDGIRSADVKTHLGEDISTVESGKSLIQRSCKALLSGVWSLLVPDHKANEEMIDSLLPDTSVDFPDLIKEMDAAINEDDEFMDMVALKPSRKPVPARVLNQVEVEKAHNELEETIIQRVADTFGSDSPEMKLFLEGFNEEVISDFYEKTNSGDIELDDDVFA